MSRFLRVYLIFINFNGSHTNVFCFREFRHKRFIHLGLLIKKGIQEPLSFPFSHIPHSLRYQFFQTLYGNDVRKGLGNYPTSFRSSLP